MDVMAPFTYFITSLLHVEETESTLWSDKIREGRRGGRKGGGAFWGNIFFFLHLQHYISFYLAAFLSLILSLSSLSLTWLFPFNDLQDTYCVFSFRLNFIGKKHTSEHRFNARTRVWNTPLKSSCTRLLKFTRKTRRLNTETLLHASVCPCTYAHTHATAHVMNGVHSNVQAHTHALTQLTHTHKMTYM